MGIGSAIAHPVASAVRRLDSQKGANLPGEGPRLLSILAAWIRACCDEHKAKVVYFASMGKCINYQPTAVSLGGAFLPLPPWLPVVDLVFRTSACFYMYITKVAKVKQATHQRQHFVGSSLLK